MDDKEGISFSKVLFRLDSLMLIGMVHVLHSRMRVLNIRDNWEGKVLQIIRPLVVVIVNDTEQVLRIRLDYFFGRLNQWR